MRVRHLPTSELQANADAKWVAEQKRVERLRVKRVAATKVLATREIDQLIKDQSGRKLPRKLKDFAVGSAWTFEECQDLIFDEFDGDIWEDDAQALEHECSKERRKAYAYFREHNLIEPKPPRLSRADDEALASLNI